MNRDLIEADKVVIGQHWFAMLDGELVYGDVNKHHELLLTEPRPVSGIAIDFKGLPGSVAIQLADKARRAEHMLQAVPHPLGPFENPAMRGLTEQQRKDAAALLHGTKEFPLYEPSVRRAEDGYMGG